jgi:hypothetical protein
MLSRHTAKMSVAPMSSEVTVASYAIITLNVIQNSQNYIHEEKSRLNSWNGRYHEVRSILLSVTYLMT